MEQMELDESSDMDSQNFGTVVTYPEKKSRINRERLIELIDCVDTKVESLRKEALKLHDQKDRLLLSIDLIKNNEYLEELSESEREEVRNYVQRVNDRLQTVDLHVSTVRDTEQEDSLNRINSLMDDVIRSDDQIFKRKKFTEYLSACSSTEVRMSTSSEVVLIDKKFENTLLGCTLDDQKRIKKRLEALLIYLGQKIITE